MDKKVYVVTETTRENGTYKECEILGVFTTEETARKCLADAKERILRDWSDIVTDNEDEWEIYDGNRQFNICDIVDYEYICDIGITATDLQDEYKSVKEYTDQMNPQQLEMFKELSQELGQDIILYQAKRDQEKPMGYLLTLIRDKGLPKTSGWIVAEALLRQFNIDNENCPWLNNI